MVATCSDLDNLKNVELLQRRIAAGEPFPDSAVREMNVYSAAPGDILGDGKEALCFSPVESAGGGSTQRRKRKVGGSDDDDGERCWHQDQGKKPILSADKKSIVAYKRTLYYVSKVKNPNLHGSDKKFIYIRLGWAMIEIELKQPDGADPQPVVFCKVYKSTRTHTEAATAMAAAGAEAAPIKQGNDGEGGGGLLDGKAPSPSPPQPTSSLATLNTQEAEIPSWMRGMRGWNVPCSDVAASNVFGPSQPQAAVKAKSCDPQAPGTVSVSIVWQSNVTMLNIESTQMLNDFEFSKMCLSVFWNWGIHIDCATIGQGNISLIAVPSNRSSRKCVQHELDNIVEQLQKFAVVRRLEDRSVISLTGNTQMWPLILEKAFHTLRTIGIKVQMIHQELSSEVVKVSLVVHDSEAEHCEQALHSTFFEVGFVPQVQGAEQEFDSSQITDTLNPSAAASSGLKRKAPDGDIEMEAQSGMYQQRKDTVPSFHMSFNNNYLTPPGGVPAKFYNGTFPDTFTPISGDDNMYWARGLDDILPEGDIRPIPPLGLDVGSLADRPLDVSDYSLWAGVDGEQQGLAEALLMTLVQTPDM